MEQNQEVQKVTENTAVMPSYGDSASFEHMQRVAKALSASSLIPKDYQQNIPNTMIALEFAYRMGVSPLMVMQNLYVVHGKPAWSGKYIIGAINGCKKFKGSIAYEEQGEVKDPNYRIRAYSFDRITGSRLNGTWIDWAMVKGEGWLDKTGSKWKTMPEQMFKYRAGSMFGNTYAPELLMGLPSVDEVEDFMVMISPQQEEMALQLLETSAYDEKRKQGIKWEITHDCSAERAHLIINDLIANQPNPIDAGSNYNQGDIKRKQAQTLNL